ncbi:hypothetical protein AB1N83_014220, partial [Pleurotus pulmonarius]
CKGPALETVLVHWLSLRHWWRLR